MIEYKDIVGKRVILVIVEGEEPNTSLLVPGVASVNEDIFMFEVKPDPEYVHEGFMEKEFGERKEDDWVGLGLETFENDIIFPLKEDHKLRQQYNVEYMIVV